MISKPSNARGLVEEFQRQPYGPHSPALQALLNRLRTRPRRTKLVLYREPSGGFRLYELERDPVRLRTAVPEPFLTLEDAERAAFSIRWRETFGEAPGDGGRR
ncbi:MAG: hypothetical protein AB7S41_03240 [Parvibaculaceae bacterium]